MAGCIFTELEIADSVKRSPELLSSGVDPPRLSARRRRIALVPDARRAAHPCSLSVSAHLTKDLVTHRAHLLRRHGSEHAIPSRRLGVIGLRGPCFSGLQVAKSNLRVYERIPRHYSEHDPSSNGDIAVVNDIDYDQGTL